MFSFWKAQYYQSSLIYIYIYTLKNKQKTFIPIRPFCWLRQWIFIPASVKYVFKFRINTFFILGWRTNNIQGFSHQRMHSFIFGIINPISCYINIVIHITSSISQLNSFDIVPDIIENIKLPFILPLNKLVTAPFFSLVSQTICYTITDKLDPIHKTNISTW